MIFALPSLSLSESLCLPLPTHALTEWLTFTLMHSVVESLSLSLSLSEGLSLLLQVGVKLKTHFHARTQLECQRRRPATSGEDDKMRMDGWMMMMTRLDYLSCVWRGEGLGRGLCNDCNMRFSPTFPKPATAAPPLSPPSAPPSDASLFAHHMLLETPHVLK